MRLAPLTHDGVEGGGEKVLVPRLERGGEGVELAGGEAGGVGEEGGEALDHAHMVADAGAGGAGECGEEGGDGGVGGVEVALMDGVQDEGGLLPRGDGFADLVLGHHLGEGLGDGLGGAEEGGDRRVAKGAAGGEAAETGDEAVFVRVARGGKLPDLDGGAEALGRDGVLEELEGLGVERGAVAEEGVGGDFGDGEVVEGVHGRCSFGGRERRVGLA